MSLSMLLAVGLGILALAFVLSPLTRYLPAKATSHIIQTHGNDVLKTSVTSAATEREESARSALQEIELDYQLGNISEEDYNTLRERYMRRALIALKSRHDNGQDVVVTEIYSREKELDNLIEEQLRKLKEQETDATE
jgi:hypothetical protein